MLSKLNYTESGITLIETLVALALIGIIGLTFLSGLATTSKATANADERTTAESLAQSQMEWTKNVDYVYDAAEYSPAETPDVNDYAGYSSTIAAQPLHNPDDGIQKITVTVKRSGKGILKLEGYKVDR